MSHVSKCFTHTKGCLISSFYCRKTFHTWFRLAGSICRRRRRSSASPPSPPSDHSCTARPLFWILKRFSMIGKLWWTWAAIQYTPENSTVWGVRLLKRFCKMGFFFSSPWQLHIGPMACEKFMKHSPNLCINLTPPDCRSLDNCWLNFPGPFIWQHDRLSEAVLSDVF